MTYFRFFLVLLFVFWCLSCHANDTSFLKNIVNAYSENQSSIHSWQGECDRVTISQGKVTGKMEKSEKISFACDVAKGNFFSKIVVHKFEYDKSKVFSPALDDVSIMVNNEVYFVLHSFHSPDGTVLKVDANGENENLTNTLHIHSQKPPISELNNSKDFFSPFSHMDKGNQNVSRDFSFFITRLTETSRENLPSGYKLNQDKNIATIKSDKADEVMHEIEAFTIDLEKGAFLLEYDYSLDYLSGEKKGIFVKRKFSNTPQKVNAVWIPLESKQSEIISEQGNVVREEIVEERWVHNAINIPIEESTFSLTNMGLRKGDQVYDLRTGETYFASGDDLLAPRPISNLERVFSKKMNYAFMFCGLLLIVFALGLRFNILRRRYS